MAIESTQALKQGKTIIPVSKKIFPQVFGDRLKYIFWHFYTPLHPFVRDIALALNIVKHNGRQDFLLGTIAPGETIESIVLFLVSKGYGNHFIAWVDDGEVVSLRFMNNFRYQYHVRIFEDGEVRVHYEYTPECFPILHFRAVGQEPRRQEFLVLLGKRIIPTAV